MAREICSMCYGINRVGYGVDVQVYKAVVPKEFHGLDKIVCLNCFTRLGDEKNVQWDNDMEFFPMSFISHNVNMINELSEGI